MSTATETRTCKRCNGTKLNPLVGLPNEAGSPCYACAGVGHFAPPDIPALLKEIRGRKGGLCSKRPNDRRAYYVWRMARFHGGVDVTMPVCAVTENRNDAYLAELDNLADAVARTAFGTDMAAAHRWSGLLGQPLDLPGLPPTAYPCGPVVMGAKPDCEILELVG